MCERERQKKGHDVPSSFVSALLGLGIVKGIGFLVAAAAAAGAAEEKSCCDGMCSRW